MANQSLSDSIKAIKVAETTIVKFRGLSMKSAILNTDVPKEKGTDYEYAPDIKSSVEWLQDWNTLSDDTIPYRNNMSGYSKLYLNTKLLSEEQCTQLISLINSRLNKCHFSDKYADYSKGGSMSLKLINTPQPA